MIDSPGNGTPADEDCPLTFDGLYQKHHKKSFYYVARRVRSQRESLDVFQESWTAIFVRFEEGPPPENWHQFIWGVIRNKIVDHARERLKDPECMELSDLDYFAEKSNLKSEDPDIGEVDEQRRCREALRYALKNDLTVIQRKAVWLRYVDRFTIQEIADVMKVSRSTARKHVERGIAAARKSMAKAGFLVPVKEAK